MALIALGLAAVQFLSSDVPGDLPVTPLLASTVVVTGMVLIVLGTVRYLRGRDRIEAATFTPAARRSFLRPPWRSAEG